MNITKNINGSLTVSDIINGHLVSKTYYGYNIKEAKNIFKEETKGN